MELEKEIKKDKKGSQNKRSLGGEYEQLAGAYLVNKGYQILEYNFRCRFGEIDLILLDNNTIVFVEVKYRKSKSMVHSLESVGYKKQIVISKCAKYYLMKKANLHRSCRFDVIGFEGDKLIHIENAFDYIGYH